MAERMWWHCIYLVISTLGYRRAAPDHEEPAIGWQRVGKAVENVTSCLKKLLDSFLPCIAMAHIFKSISFPSFPQSLNSTPSLSGLNNFQLPLALYFCSAYISLSLSLLCSTVRSLSRILVLFVTYTQQYYSWTLFAVVSSHYHINTAQ